MASAFTLHSKLSCLPQKSRSYRQKVGATTWQASSDVLTHRSSLCSVHRTSLRGRARSNLRQGLHGWQSFRTDGFVQFKSLPRWGQGRQHEQPTCNAAYTEVAGSSNQQRPVQEVQKVQSIPELQQQFCCPGIEFQEVGGLRVALLKLAEGSSVRVILEGARVIAWKAVMYHKGKEELIYSKINRTAQEGDSLLRGGIPISFPEAAGGVAGKETGDRNDLSNLIKWMPWQVVSTWSDGDAFAEIVMTLEDTPESRALWNHPFKLRYSVHQMPDRLVTVFQCRNTDSRPFSFSASLDSHLAVVNSKGAHLSGLEGSKRFVRKRRAQNWEAKGVERRQEVPLGSRVDAFFLRPKFDISLFDRGGYRTLNLLKEGFQGVLAVETAAVEQDTFVCLGSGSHEKVKLLPGETWEGRQTIQLGS